MRALLAEVGRTRGLFFASRHPWVLLVILVVVVVIVLLQQRRDR